MSEEVQDLAQFVPDESQVANTLFGALNEGLTIKVDGRRYCLRQKDQALPRENGEKEERIAVYTGIFLALEAWNANEPNDTYVRWVMASQELQFIYALAKSITPEEYITLCGDIALNKLKER